MVGLCCDLRVEGGDSLGHLLMVVGAGGLEGGRVRSVREAEGAHASSNTSITS